MASPAATVVVTDFDGTLSPIVVDPAAARPLPGAPALLHGLAARYRRVAVVSGRPVAFLAERLGAAARPSSRLVLSGLYGLERWEAGRVVEAPEAAAWRPVVAGAVRAARAADLGGADVEDKGLALTLHVRAVPEAAPVAEQWARNEAARTGLVVHGARRSVELRPPLEVDKGRVVDDLVAGAGAACFLGDDAGDLPAFDALDRLAAQGGASTVRIAVRSSESPPELLARADVVVDGPGGALGLLHRLLDAGR